LVPVLLDELHAGAVQEVLHVTLVEGHPLQNSELHLVLSFVRQVAELLDLDAFLEGPQLNIFVYPIQLKLGIFIWTYR
jgi:hypothetical protein